MCESSVTCFLTHGVFLHLCISYSVHISLLAYQIRFHFDLKFILYTAEVRYSRCTESVSVYHCYTQHLHLDSLLHCS